jgi:anti-sigma B factor antagonist
MKIELEATSHSAVVRIEGSVDGLTAETLLTTLRAYVEAGNVRLVADLSQVVYTSSAGLRALLATVKEARSRGGDLRLAAVTPNVHKVLELSGFTSILKLYDGVGPALDSFVLSAPKVP